VGEIAIREARFDDAPVRALLAEWDAELGFSPKCGSRVEPNDFEPPEGAFLVATENGTPVGCGGLRSLTSNTGEIKRLFVIRTRRGRAIGRRLLDGLEHEARRRSLRELRLDTDGGNPAALGLFRIAGYQPIADYNGNPYARHWFAKHLDD
jgi:ribosomal protein S18 acetylase RimI-like enzyme